MIKGKKDVWVPCFRDKEKHLPLWANTNGSNIVEEGTHNDGPSNKVFRAAGGGKIPISSSQLYRERYDFIQWEQK